MNFKIKKNLLKIATFFYIKARAVTPGLMP